MPDDEALTDLAVTMLARRDQLLLLDKITALEKRVKLLEEQLRHFFGTPVPITKKSRRKK